MALDHARCKTLQATDFPGGELCTACKKEVDMKQEIRETKAKLATLEVALYSLRTEINEVHGFGMQGIPLELITLIFKFSVTESWFEDEDEEEDQIYWDISLFPRKVYPRLKLGHVCHSWRKLAWSIPQLWNAISINLVFADNNVTMLEGWLTRSKLTPLSIHLFYKNVHQYYQPRERLHLQACVTLLDQHADRFRNLRINIPGTMVRHLRDTLPNLRMLEFGPERIYSIENLLNRLVVPSLVAYEQPDFQRLADDPFPVDSLIALIRRSSCSLKKMTFKHLSLPTGSLLELLKVTPTLIDLKIGTNDGSSHEESTEMETFLVHFGATADLNGGKDGDVPFLPTLRVLSINEYRSFSWETLANIFGSGYSNMPTSVEKTQRKMTNSGVRPLRNLRYLRIHSHWHKDYVDGKVIPQFMNAARGGLKICGHWLRESTRHHGMECETRDLEKMGLRL